MGLDRKYGRVTVEHGTIGDDEPVVVFRAQDQLLPELLGVYAQMCVEHGSPAEHITGVDATARQVIEWQRENHTQIPRSSEGGGQ